MKIFNSRSVVSRLTVFALALSILNGQALVALAGTSAGELTVTGQMPTNEKPYVMVNGDRAFSGRSFFSDGTIATTETTSATINLGKAGRIEVGPASVLTLSFSSDTISGTLSSGNIRIANSEGVAVKINTPNDVVTNEENAASVFSVVAGPDASNVSAESGKVRYNNGKSVAAKQQDDDDDDNKYYWVPLVVFGGAAAAILFITLGSDDDDVVSPIR
jgi:hypothetical protein